MYEIDVERIQNDFLSIKSNLNYIYDKKIKSVEDLKGSKDTYFAVSMALFTILNKMIVIGEELIDSLDKGIHVKKYSDIPDVLLSEKIISKEQCKVFSDLIKYRNDIAHEYDEIFESEIFWCLKNLKFIEEFVKIVKRRVLDSKE